MLKPMRDARSKLIQFKILNRLYWTPLKLYRAKMMQTNTCWRCHSAPGDLLHMFLTCPNIAGFWRDIMAKLCSSLKCQVVLTPQLCLLNLVDPKGNVKGKRSSWLKTAFTMAKRIILRHWKGQHVPTFSEWINALSETAAYERLIYKINGQMDTYEKIWEPFLLEM